MGVFAGAAPKKGLLVQVVIGLGCVIGATVLARHLLVPAVPQLEPLELDGGAGVLPGGAAARGQTQTIRTQGIRAAPKNKPLPPAICAARKGVSPAAGGSDSTGFYVKPIVVKENEIATSFEKNPTGRLATVHVPGTDVGFAMFVHDPKKCKYISKSILVNHKWEGDHASRLIQALRSGSAEHWMLDIGANVGYFGLAAAASGFSVVAIEPSQYNTELIAASAGVLSHPSSPQYRLYKTAVATESGESLCAMPNLAPGGDAMHNQGNIQLRPLDDCKKHGDGFTSTEVVPVKSIDDILAGDPALKGVCFSAVKIDVEGFETKALKGAMSVLCGQCPPCFILLEYIQQPELFELLVGELGYECQGLGAKRANGQWKTPPVNATPPFSQATDQDYQCRLAREPRCRDVPMLAPQGN